MAARTRKAWGHCLSRSGECLYGGGVGADGRAAEDALRRDAEPYQGDGCLGSLPRQAVLVLLADGGGSAVSDLLPEDGFGGESGGGCAGAGDSGCECAGQG